MLSGYPDPQSLNAMCIVPRRGARQTGRLNQVGTTRLSEADPPPSRKKKVDLPLNVRRIQLSSVLQFAWIVEMRGVLRPRALAPKVRAQIESWLE